MSDYLGSKEDYIFKNIKNPCPYLSKGTQLWPMYLNNDVHKKIRRTITKAFHSLPLDELITSGLELTLVEFKDKDRFNLVDFCGKFIYHFIKKALNINTEEYNRIKSFSNLLARSQDLYIPRQLYQEINAEIIFHKNSFGKSLFQDTILEEEKGINEDSLYSIMLISFMASFETSKDNLSLALYEILKKPQLTNHLLNTDEKGLKDLIEETFRFSNPLQYTVRINTYPLNIGGYLIPENSKLYLCIASANRDETVFDKANELIPERTYNPHLAFGAGSHKCLGSAIARKEMELCLQPMIHFLKNYEVEEIKWAKQIFMRTANTIGVKIKK